MRIETQLGLCATQTRPCIGPNARTMLRTRGGWQSVRQEGNLKRRCDERAKTNESVKPAHRCISRCIATCGTLFCDQLLSSFPNIKMLRVTVSYDELCQSRSDASDIFP